MAKEPEVTRSRADACVELASEGRTVGKVITKILINLTKHNPVIKPVYGMS